MLLQIAEAHLTQLLDTHLVILERDIVEYYYLLYRRTFVDDPAHLFNFHLRRNHETGVGVVDAEGQVVIRFKLV